MPITNERSLFMNVREEHEYQKLLNLLGELQLSEKNYNIAKSPGRCKIRHRGLYISTQSQ